MLFRSSRLRLELADRIATLWMHGRNVLDRELLFQFDEALAVLGDFRGADVLVIRRAGPGAFLVGPDLSEYADLTDAESRRLFARHGQSIMNRLEMASSQLATVAMIAGSCLNAGLELALACDFRLAVAHPGTWIGFDAALDGMLPCWGGSHRLARKIGLPGAERLLGRGELLATRAAHKAGIVDHVFDSRAAKTELAWFLARVQDDHIRGRRDRPGWRHWLDRLVPSASAGTAMGRLACESLRRTWAIGAADAEARERAIFARESVHACGDLGRELAQRRIDMEEMFEPSSSPQRIGIVGVGPLAEKWAVQALTSGASVSLLGTDADSLRPAMRDAVDAGLWNIAEAEAARKTIAMPFSMGELGNCDMVVMVGGKSRKLAALDSEIPAEVPVAVLLAGTFAEVGFEAVGHPERLFGMREVGGSIRIEADRTYDVRGLAHVSRWLGRCGRHVSLPSPVEVSQRLSEAA